MMIRLFVIVLLTMLFGCSEEPKHKVLFPSTFEGKYWKYDLPDDVAGIASAKSWTDEEWKDIEFYVITE